MRPYGKSEFAEEFNVSRETLDELAVFREELLKWNRSINLVAKNAEERLWHRHIADSAQLVSLIPETAAQLADLGSGGGFPGLVLAIILKNDPIEFTFIDSDQRKSAFLQNMIIRLRLNAKVRSERIATIDLSNFDIVTARALAKTSELLETIDSGDKNPLCLFLKGEKAQAELDDCKKHWNMDARLIPSRTDPSSSVIRIGAFGRARH